MRPSSSNKKLQSFRKGPIRENVMCVECMGSVTPTWNTCFFDLLSAVGTTPRNSVFLLLMMCMTYGTATETSTHRSSVAFLISSKEGSETALRKYAVEEYVH